jgi:hypothetical protein
METNKNTKQKDKMNTNKVSLATVEEIQAVTAALKALHEKMTFVTPLSPEERRQAGKLGSKKVRTTVLRLEAARQHRDALPPAFDLRLFERQTALLSALDECVTAAGMVDRDLRDTLLSLGSGAVQSGKHAFAHIQATAEASNKIGQAVKGLKLRSNRTRREKAAPPPAEAAPAPKDTAPAAPSAEPTGPPPTNDQKAA